MQLLKKGLMHPPPPALGEQEGQAGCVATLAKGLHPFLSTCILRAATDERCRWAPASAILLRSVGSGARVSAMLEDNTLDHQFGHVGGELA